MKALYEIAEVEIVKFAIEDIITTSEGGDSGDIGQGGSGGPNEGESGSFGDDVDFG